VLEFFDVTSAVAAWQLFTASPPVFNGVPVTAIAWSIPDAVFLHLQTTVPQAPIPVAPLPPTPPPPPMMACASAAASQLDPSRPNVEGMAELMRRLEALEADRHLTENQQQRIEKLDRDLAAKKRRGDEQCAAEKKLGDAAMAALQQQLEELTSNGMAERKRIDATMAVQKQPRAPTGGGQADLGAEAGGRAGAGRISCSGSCGS
jgi:hypothetical protein